MFIIYVTTVRIKRISIETKRNFPTTDTMDIGKSPLANSVGIYSKKDTD